MKKIQNEKKKMLKNIKKDWSSLIKELFSLLDINYMVRIAGVITDEI